MTEAKFKTTIADNTVRSLPRGEEGLSRILELQNQAMMTVYPEAEQYLPKLVTCIDQLRWLRQEDLEKKSLEPNQEKIIFRLFQALDVSPFVLKNHFLKERVYSYFDCETDDPLIYLPKNSLNKLEDINPVKRAEEAVNLAVNVFECNLNLLPTPLPLSEDYQDMAIRVCRREIENKIHKVFVEVGERFEESELAALEGVIYGLIYAGQPDYQIRVVHYGGCLLLTLPHQNIDSAEGMGQGEEHKDIYVYLAKPVIDELFTLVEKEGYIKGKMRLKLTDEMVVKAERGARRLKKMGVEDRQEAFRLFVTSELSQRILEL